MRLHNLKIENFRSFEDYKLDGLARVNLIVGGNNSGKTSVIEAGYLLTSSEPMNAVIAITTMRGETCRLNQHPPTQQPTIVPTVDSFFHGRSIDSGVPFKITGSSTHFGRKEPAEFVAEIHDWKYLNYGAESEYPNIPSGALRRFEVKSRFEETTSSRRIFMASDGGLFTNFWSGTNSFAFGKDPPKQLHLNSEFVPLAGWDARELAIRWDQVLQSGGRQIVVDCLRILHPNIEDVIFLPGTIGISQRLGGIMIQLTNEKRPIPLTSMGDGTQRLLVMATAVSSSEDGTLYIDEIDTGLHYSKLPDMWRLMIQSAVENNVQITATTHSLDCIRALAAACDDDETLREEVAMFSIDRRMDEAVRYGGDELSTVVHHEIEVR